MNKGTKIILGAAAGLAISASAAFADCKVSDSDKRGVFGGDKTYSTTFRGNSAKRIWDRQCKPWIQRQIANKNIRNGSFGMECSGSLSCNVQGRIRNGRVQTLQQRF